MNYKQSCDFIETTKKDAHKLGLVRMQYLLHKLNNPENELKAIHIAGTNGKGSTLTYLKNIFKELGYSIGTFMSPYNTKRNDQIQINGEIISDENFTQLVSLIQPIVKEMETSIYGAPNEYEVMTALSLYYFSLESNLDMIVVETGLGGRLDPTNVITPILTIITNVGHDHLNILGPTLLNVAEEKAGIIKRNVPLISGCKQSDVMKLIRTKAEQATIPFFQLGQEFKVIHNNTTFIFESNNERYENLKLGMTGEHQQDNAALALMAMDYLQMKYKFPVEVERLKTALYKAKISNRVELYQKYPPIIFDGGHNQEGIEALIKTLRSEFPAKRFHIVFCAMKDKNIEQMVQPLYELAYELVLTTFPHDRVMNPTLVREMLEYEGKKVSIEKNAMEAFEYLKGNLKRTDVLVLTGSFYFLNYIRNELGRN